MIYKFTSYFSTETTLFCSTIQLLLLISCTRKAAYLEGFRNDTGVFPTDSCV